MLNFWTATIFSLIGLAFGFFMGVDWGHKEAKRKYGTRHPSIEAQMRAEGWIKP